MEHARFIEVRAAISYWEDGTLNGQVDADGRIPLRDGELWTPTIELATGRVVDWPAGTTAYVHYKVADQGRYWLLDASRTRIASWKGSYVPEFYLCHGQPGLGDYIILRIGADGLVSGWLKPHVEADDWNAIAAPVEPTILRAAANAHPAATLSLPDFLHERTS
jgi:hypothetical protein